jgi:hypothetical protein
VLRKDTYIDYKMTEDGYEIHRTYWCEESQQRFWEYIQPEVVVDALEALRKLYKELDGLGFRHSDFL